MNKRHLVRQNFLRKKRVKAQIFVTLSNAIDEVDSRVKVTWEFMYDSAKRKKL